MNFSKRLILWYLANKRDLPWRGTTDPYFIWLSEIILQQTRVTQGLPYFLTFTESFPTVFDLAKANEQQILKLWQGLGYYSRARNLHKTAIYIANELGGTFPKNYDSLLKLNGVGEYTAAAIASFSYNESVPVVDGNVFRLLSRYYGIETDIVKASAKVEFSKLARKLMPKDDASTFNQAIMEFGAMQCVPKKPVCSTCPLNSGCVAFTLGKVEMFPVKSKKQKPKNRYFNYMVISDEDNNTILQKRTGKGIWENLYEFPLVETLTEADTEYVLSQLNLENEIVSSENINQHSIIHKLTHQHLHIKFRKIKVKGLVVNGISTKNVHQYPVPVVLFNFIEQHWK